MGMDAYPTKWRVGLHAGRAGAPWQQRGRQVAPQCSGFRAGAQRFLERLHGFVPAPGLMGEQAERGVRVAVVGIEADGPAQFSSAFAGRFRLRYNERKARGTSQRTGRLQWPSPMGRAGSTVPRFGQQVDPGCRALQGWWSRRTPRSNAMMAHPASRGHVDHAQIDVRAGKARSMRTQWRSSLTAMCSSPR